MNAIHHNEMDEHKLVEYAALAESASSHPISKSLREACGELMPAVRPMLRKLLATVSALWWTAMWCWQATPA